jgi:anaerobic magnesium-protoporphyrin IX monomethyl ester cyclase
MRVLLVGPDFEENLSLGYLASSLEAARHAVRVVAFNAAADTQAVVEAARDADLVGLSVCFQARAREFLALARALKARAPALRVVAGGHYASCAAEELLAHHPELDLVVLHEAERTLVELANAGPEFERRLPELAGIVYRDGSTVRRTAVRPILEDLDALPMPVRPPRPHRQVGVPMGYLLGSRGCLGACAYCCITTLHRLAPGRCFRQRTPENVAREMAMLHFERGVRQFVFHDDNFLVPSVARNHARLEALGTELSRLGVEDIALVIKCRPQDAERSVFRRLRDMGLLRVFFGIETGSEQGLRCLNRSHTVAQAEEALELCRELGVSAQYTIMVFHPDATAASIREDIAFMRRNIDHALNFCRTEAYAGTPLERRVMAEGRARGDYLAHSYTLSDAVADRACHLWKRLFLARCGDARGLMNTAIGLDYRSAALARFYPGPGTDALREAVRTWCAGTFGDSVDLLEELVGLAEKQVGRSDGALSDEIARFTQREESRRTLLTGQGAALTRQLEAFAAGMKTRAVESSPLPLTLRSPRPSGLAQKASALVLAGLAAACAEPRPPLSEMAAPPMDAGAQGTAPNGTEDAATDEPLLSEVAPPPVDPDDPSDPLMVETAPAPVEPDLHLAEMAASPLEDDSSSK